MTEIFFSVTQEASLEVPANQNVDNILNHVLHIPLKLIITDTVTVSLI